MTTDGNTNANESVTNTIKELNDVVRHFGLSRYTLTNIPSRLEREYEPDLDEEIKESILRWLTYLVDV